MPRIPGASNIRRQRAPRDPGLRVSPQAFGAEAAQAEAELGRDIQAAGSEIGDLADTLQRVEARFREAERARTLSNKKAQLLERYRGIKQDFQNVDDPDTAREQAQDRVDEAFNDVTSDVQDEQVLQGLRDFANTQGLRTRFEVVDTARVNQIDASRADLINNAETLKAQYADAETPDERESVFDTATEMFANAAQTGIIDRETAAAREIEFRAQADFRRASLDLSVDPVGFLDDIQNRDKYTELTEDQRTRLEVKARNAVETERRSELKSLRREVSNAVAVLEEGRIPETDTQGLKQRLSEIGGDDANSLLSELERAEADREEMFAFAQRPITEQRQIIEDVDRSEPTTRADLEQQERLVRLHESIVKGLQSDPMGTAVRFGIIDESVDLSSGADFVNIDKLSQRREQADQIEATWGVSIGSPLSDAENDALVATLNQVDAGEATVVLDSLHEGFGRDATMRIAQQMEGDEGALKLAVTYAEDHRARAQDLVLASRVLKNQSEVLPGKSVIEQGFNDVFGNAFQYTPETREYYWHATRALLAKDLSENPEPGGGDPSADRVERAARMAAGSSKTSGGGMVGGPFEFRDQVVLPPLRFSENETMTAFNNLDDDVIEEFGNGNPVDARGERVTAEHIAEEGKLVTFAPGRYAIALSDGGLVQRENARPNRSVYVLDLGEAMESGVLRTQGASPRRQEVFGEAAGAS